MERSEGFDSRCAAAREQPGGSDKTTRSRFLPYGENRRHEQRRAGRAAVIVRTNMPFPEWTAKIPNARLCKAMRDRLTDQANIIATGKDSFRFKRALQKTNGQGGKA